MLSAKTWKTDAIVRLLVGIFICMFAGSLVLTALRPHPAGTKHGSVLFLISAALLLLITALVSIHRPWRVETLLRHMVFVMACVYAGMILGAWGQHLAGSGSGESAVLRMIVATMSFQGAAIVLIYRFLRDHQATWSEAFGFRSHLPQALLFGVLGACIFLPIGWWLQKMSIEILQHIPRHPVKAEEQEAVQALRIASSWFHRVTLGVVTILLAPAAEEMLFRGILYPWIKRVGFPRLALGLTSLLFAAMHLNLATFVPLFVLSIALSLIYEKTGNLLAPITTHALFNAANFLTLYIWEKQLS